MFAVGAFLRVFGAESNPVDSSFTAECDRVKVASGAVAMMKYMTERMCEFQR